MKLLCALKLLPEDSFLWAGGGLNELLMELTEEVSCMKLLLLVPGPRPLPGSALPIELSAGTPGVPFPVPLFPLSSRKVFFR